MIPTAYYNGERLTQGVPIEKALSGILTPEEIERIEHKAYSTACCIAMQYRNYARPVIDYGTQKVIQYEAAMPVLTEKGCQYQWELWEYCPFCGKPFARDLHDKTQSILEDFNE